MLPKIDGVSNFQVYENISDANNYYVYMEFADLNAYRYYEAHPLHYDYVKNIWSKVSGEIEIYDMKKVDTDILLYEGDWNE